MFHIRTINNRINKIYETILSLAYKDEKNIFFDELLKKDKSVSIQQRNLQILATETQKVRSDLGPEIVKIFFTLYRNHTI